MSNTSVESRTALWSPGWYELDQPLVAGECGRFWFFLNPPTDYPDVESYDFVFFNQLTSSSNCQVRKAKIVSILHPELGELRSIETNGLDYVFKQSDGSEVIVNAEEDPGTIYDLPIKVENWAIQVRLSEISEPLQEAV